MWRVRDAVLHYCSTVLALSVLHLTGVLHVFSRSPVANVIGAPVPRNGKRRPRCLAEHIPSNDEPSRVTCRDPIARLI